MQKNQTPSSSTDCLPHLNKDDERRALLRPSLLVDRPASMVMTMPASSRNDNETTKIAYKRRLQRRCRNGSRVLHQDRVLRLLLALIVLAVMILAYTTGLDGCIRQTNNDGSFLSRRFSAAIVSFGDWLSSILSHANGGSEDFGIDDSEMGTLRTVQDMPGFFGYSAPTKNDAIHVSYNARSIRINDKPLLLLGGSLHPVRHSPATWEVALDRAVQLGLNLVTIYVMWSAHAPWPDQQQDAFDGRLFASDYVCRHDDKDCWTLATAIQQAARRRLWVHVRIGPYVCAEYNYGGIPEWVAVSEPNMSMRRPNRPWLTAMEGYVRRVMQYLAAHKLWAHQGGNIILGQIENELQGSVDDADAEHILWMAANGTLVDDWEPGARRATLQDYANWCGQLVQDVEPQIIWTMCNGMTAPNTMETFNGVDGSDWLDRQGHTGRIQVDVPALWSEFEGGFQIWGDDATDPSGYFWGQTGRQYVYRALRWIARGGTHLNYYMLSGGYNRDRMSAAGITNMYASDAPICASGEPRHPKFGHLQRMHALMKEYAMLLLLSPTRAWAEPVQIKASNGTWIDSSSETQLFRYVSEPQFLVFVENMRNESVWARWTGSQGETVTAQLNSWSVSVYDGVVLKMDSTQIEWKAKNYRRYFRQLHLGPPTETRGISLPRTCQAGVVNQGHPIEQTEIMLKFRTWSDYVWYATEWNQTSVMDRPLLTIETQLANAFVVYLDGRRVAANETHPHLEDPTTLTFSLPAVLKEGFHRLDLLSESLGYDNIIGVWGASSQPKTKGITGNVYLHNGNITQSLVRTGQEWCSCPGLDTCQPTRSRADDDSHETAVFRSIWRFPTPLLNADEQLFVNVRKGRGHLTLNGIDLGRYWNITRKHSGLYSQPNYFLPPDYLQSSGENELILDNVLGSPHGDVQVVATQIVPGSVIDFRQGMEDEVDYPLACF